MKPERIVIIVSGAGLFILGAVWELRNYFIEAWPTFGTWILMVCGFGMVAFGLWTGKSRR